MTRRYPSRTSGFVKFSSKMDGKVLDELRKLADASGRTLAFLLTEASAEYLARARVRPAVRTATRDPLRHEELLRRLAK